MSLLDWLLGGGRNPLEAPARERVPEPPVEAVTPVPGADELRQRATQYGVTAEVMERMLAQRDSLGLEVAADPRAFGLDLLPPCAPRHDLEAEYRTRTRLQGGLAASFLADDGRLLGLAPDPPTMPDGTPLPEHLVRAARIGPEAAADIAGHLRSTMQARLGRPLDAEAVEHAVREASWDHELDAATVAPDVLRALRDMV